MPGQHESQHDMLQNWKRNSNIAVWLATIHQRGIVVMCRKYWGTQALGLPCFFALLLMMAWAAFSRDLFMYIWIAVWLACFLKRRMEAVRIERQVDSRYDGYSFDAMRYCNSEATAKRVVEPILVAILGAIVYWLYTRAGLSPYGLPYYLLTGAFTLPLVEGVKQAAWKKRLRDMRDAQLENEMSVRDFNDQYGR